jgi:hypothetical protein
MNSLPLIHHHLFVAAIGSGDRACRKPERGEDPRGEPARPARLPSWEDLPGKATSAGAARSIEVSLDAAEAWGGA